MVQEVIVLRIREERLSDLRVIRRNLQEKVEPTKTTGSCRCAVRWSGVIIAAS